MDDSSDPKPWLDAASAAQAGLLGWFGLVNTTKDSPVKETLTVRRLCRRRDVGSIQVKPGEPGKFVIQPGIAEGLLITRPAPLYPAIAKAGRVQGTVVLRGTIGKDGLVMDLDVVDGPPLLRQAALDAVKTWTYRPFLVAGKPVEVETTVNVVFRLGDPNPAAQQPAAGAHP